MSEYHDQIVFGQIRRSKGVVCRKLKCLDWIDFTNNGDNKCKLAKLCGLLVWYDQDLYTIVIVSHTR